MRYRDEAPQQETQEQSTEELGENILLMKMAAGPHTVRSGSPKKVHFFFFPALKLYILQSLLQHLEKGEGKKILFHQLGQCRCVSC